MQIKHERCAGIDIHKKTVVVCCLTFNANGKPQRETRTYSTPTRELLSLCDWLARNEVRQMAIGLYWGILAAYVQRVRKQL